MFLQESRAQINASLKTRSGMEPRLVLQLNEDDAIETVFAVGDAITLCQTSSIEEAILVLFATYFLLNLNYPVQFAQFLGILQVFCLRLDTSDDFPIAMQSSAFTKLRTSIESISC